MICDRTMELIISSFRYILWVECVAVNLNHLVFDNS